MPIASRKTTPFKRSSKTPTAPSKPKYRRTIILDDEDTEDENWVEDLREYLKNRLQEYLEKAGMDQRRKNLLTSVVQGYRNQLGRNRFDKHSRNDAWKSVLEIYNQHLRTKTPFDPDSDIEDPPTPVQRKRKRKVKRGGSGRVAKFLGAPIPKSPNALESSISSLNG